MIRYVFKIMIILALMLAPSWAGSCHGRGLLGTSVKFTSSYFDFSSISEVEKKRGGRARSGGRRGARNRRGGGRGRKSR